MLFPFTGYLHKKDVLGIPLEISVTEVVSISGVHWSYCCVYPHLLSLIAPIWGRHRVSPWCRLDSMSGVTECWSPVSTGTISLLVACQFCVAIKDELISMSIDFLRPEKYKFLTSFVLSCAGEFSICSTILIRSLILIILDLCYYPDAEKYEIILVGCRFSTGASFLTDVWSGTWSLYNRLHLPCARST